MNVLKQLLHSGTDIFSQLGGESGIETFIRFVASGNILDVVKESARKTFEFSPPSQREDIGHGLLGYLRNFHHAEADTAAARAGDLTQVESLMALVSSVLIVNPRFMEEVAALLLKGVPAEVANEHGPSSWLVTLLKCPSVMEAFKGLFLRMKPSVPKESMRGRHQSSAAMNL